MVLPGCRGAASRVSAEHWAPRLLGASAEPGGRGFPSRSALVGTRKGPPSPGRGVLCRQKSVAPRPLAPRPGTLALHAAAVF